MNAIPIEDELWCGSLSRNLVACSVVGYGTPLHHRVAEMLSPISEKVIGQAFDEAIGKAATEREALDLARERVTQLYNCWLAEAAFIRRELSSLRKALGEALARSR